MWVIFCLQLVWALQDVPVRPLSTEDSDTPLPLCTRYRCINDEEELLPHQCVYFNNNTYLLNPCDHWASDWYCPPVPEGYNSSCSYFPAISNTASSWPNEPCYYDENCVQGLSCVNYKCQGLPQRAPCKVHDACAPGLACIKGQCWQQIPIGMKGCTEDEDCVNSAGCNAGTCVAYLSLAPWEPVSNCVDKTSMLCETTACTDEKCAGNVTSNFALPHECQTDDDCISADGAFRGYCQCGMNADGKSFCTLFPSDDLNVELLKYMKEWIVSTNINRCNTVRRFVLECMVQVWFFAPYNLINYYSQSVNNYPQIQEIDDCTLRIYQRPYRDAMQEFVVASWAESLAVSAVISLVFA